MRPYSYRIFSCWNNLQMALPALVVILLSSLGTTTVTTAREVPMQKAIPPQMDPIPTLPEITHRVWMKISVNGEEPQRIVLGLFGKIAPRTVHNFVQLATCKASNQKYGALTGKPLCYKKSTFHRIIPHFGLQGGDFSHHDGTGGESVYGGRFADESFDVKFNRPFMLAMSNLGEKDTNGSQFFITTVKAQWLDNKHVIFGFVLENRDFVEELEGWGTYGGTPQGKVVIEDCGVEPLTEEDLEVHYS